VEKLLQQPLNIHKANDIRQTEMHIAEPLAPELSSSEVEIAHKKFKRYKLPGVHQTPAEFFQAGSKSLCSKIHNLFSLIRIRKK